MELVKSQKSLFFYKKLAIVFVGTIALAISSKIKIPFYPVPMTMQTFVVLLIGVLYGWKLGVATVCLYLLEGILGLPVFAGTPEKGVGIIYFTGPTMGYLIGFLFAVFLAGYFDYNKNIFINFFKLLIATSFIYLMGVAWLGSLLGYNKPLFEIGVQPFIIAELFKITLITLIIKKFKLNLR